MIPTMQPEHIKFIASPGHLQAIGLVTTCWSKFEWLVEELIWRLARIENGLVGHVLTAELGIQTRLNVLLSLADITIRDSEQETRLRTIQKRVVSGYMGKPSIASERNRIVHAYWSASDDKLAFASNVKAKGRLSFDIKNMKVTDLNNTAQRIFSVAIELD
ncbi:MAG: hypothetical protein O7I42_13980 [Alphaproteobacteria bacterium]|nr:hypothetical protein [Alphaproteobacteria bacterium]